MPIFRKVSHVAWATLLLFLVTSPFTVRRVAAHGTMENPISRVYQCYQEGPENPQSAACQAAVQLGSTQPLYDWNGVNLLAADQHRTLIPDGKLCSAGKATYAGFDLARTDWRAQSIAPDQNGNFEFVFRATAPHSTKYFDFYITKDGYDLTQPLTWSDLDATPFCHITSVTLVDGRYHILCPLPAGKHGKHVIYNIWQRDDSAEAFYSCSDVEFAEGNATATPTSTLSTPLATPTPTPTTPAQTTPVGATCAVDYTFRDTWSDGFEAAVAITNTGSTVLSGWTLTWSFPGNQKILSLWDGVVSQNDVNVTVTNAAWNGELSANGGSTSVGFTASFQDANQPPGHFALNGVTCTSNGQVPVSTTTPVPPTATATPGTPTPTTTVPVAHKEVVAYFTQWGIYERNYQVRNLITSDTADKLTAINYAFGNIVDGKCVMTTQSGVMDAYADYQRIFTAAESVDGQADRTDQALRGNFNQLKKLKARYPNLKVLISLGGGTWSGGFHEAAKTAAARQQVVQSCIDLYLRGNLPVVDNAGGQGVVAGLFDGIDIDWEYPGAPGNGNPYGPEDTHNFTLLLQEFRQQLNAIDPNLRLTVATSAGVDTYQLLELDQIHPLLNYINIMTYDLHGAWEAITGFNAPLYASPAAPYSAPANSYTVNDAVHGYLAAGVPSNKILIGLPFYGRGWTGVGNTNHGLWQSATGAAPGAAEAGINDYRIIKTLNYPIYRDDGSGAVWKYNGTTFWSYDDATTIAAKVAYMREHQLGGVMIWSLDGDTVEGALIHALAESLGNNTTPTVGAMPTLYLPVIRY